MLSPTIFLQPDLKRLRRNSPDWEVEIDMDTADSDHESDCDGEGADDLPMGFQEMWENAVEERLDHHKKTSRPPLHPARPTTVDTEKMNVDSWTTLKPSAQTRLPLPPPSPAIAGVQVLDALITVSVIHKIDECAFLTICSNLSTPMRRHLLPLYMGMRRAQVGTWCPRRPSCVGL